MIIQSDQCCIVTRNGTVRFLRSEADFQYYVGHLKKSYPKSHGLYPAYRIRIREKPARCDICGFPEPKHQRRCKRAVGPLWAT